MGEQNGIDTGPRTVALGVRRAPDIGSQYQTMLTIISHPIEEILNAKKIQTCRTLSKSGENTDLCLPLFQRDAKRIIEKSASLIE